MQGNFSEESLKKCEVLLGSTYDFTRCVRPNGTAYGTGGKCRKGTEQPLFESDGGIPSGASGGIIGGRLFKATPVIREPYKPEKREPQQEINYSDLRDAVRDSKKIGFAQNTKKVDNFLKRAEQLLKREIRVREESRGGWDNAFSDLHEPVIKALEKIRSHSLATKSYKAHILLEKIEESGALHGLLG